MKAEVADWKRACGADANGEYHGRSTKNHAAHGVQDASAVKARILAGLGTKRVTGLRATCGCKGSVGKPGVAVDPFFGSGTTGMVCQELGRECIGMELAAHYHPLIAERLAAPKAKARKGARKRSGGVVEWRSNGTDGRKGRDVRPIRQAQDLRQPELFAA